MNREASGIRLWTCGLIALVPPLRIFWILNRNGAFNPSNDDLAILRFFRIFLEQGFSWKWLFSDTFVAGHSHLFPMLLHLIAMKLSDWNLEGILYFGVFLALLKCLLLYEILTANLKSAWKAALLPLISALVFSSTQLSTFDFEYVTISRGLSHLGFLLGLLGLFRYPRLPKGAALVFVGGLLASFSSGNGLNVWPVYLVLLFVAGKRPWYFVAAWLLGLGSVFALYIPNLLSHPTPLSAHDHSLSFWSQYLFSGIGWTFANASSTNQARNFGIAGAIALLSWALTFVFSRERGGLQKALPALALMAFSLSNILQISLVRSALTPWYTSSFVFFWLGLAGIAFLALENSGIQGLSGGASLALICLGLIWSNREWRDKVFYLQARTPFAESCLRWGGSDNPECVRSVFLWGEAKGEDFRSISEMLMKHRWSSLGPRQKWTMQGDFPLSRVEVSAPQGSPPVAWIEDNGFEASDPKGYRHLNLRVPEETRITWKLEIPEPLQQAIFSTSVSLTKLPEASPSPQGALVEIKLQAPGKSEQILFGKVVRPEQRIPIALDLSAYDGQEIRIIFRVQNTASPSREYAAFQFPELWIKLKDNP